jgi:translation initiation factor 1
MCATVYSTDKGRLCPDCGQAKQQCCCQSTNTPYEGDGIVRIQRETKGRKGKGVTLITGVPLPDKELKKLAKELKQRCSTGGAIKAGCIEIQGDQRQIIKELLEGKGFTVKLSGG